MTVVLAVDIQGMPELISALRAIADPRLTQRAFRRGLALAARPIQAEARFNAPVRQKPYPHLTIGRKPGKFRKSIKTRSMRPKRGRVGVRIASSVFYGRFLEFGTRHMRARRPLKRAFDAQKNQVVSTVKNVVGLAVEHRFAMGRKTQGI